jgi:phenylpropionate dioxygenase-like ring-hydroxylating dioxygenase large terminal subunit
VTDTDTATDAGTAMLGVVPGTGMPRRPDYVSDASGRPKLRQESGRRFPFPLPNGWFIVAKADEIAPLEVKPLFYFNRDLVLYRTASGEPRVVSAYCAHLGAHLAAGGIVDDDVIVCPFHGWNYDGGTGKCVSIPYGSGKIPSQAKIRAYPTIERNHMVWAWFHLEGKPPFYEVPEVGEFDDPAFGDPYTVDFILNTVCQEMAENNHDTAHFQFVHGTSSIPEQDEFIQGTYKRVVGLEGRFKRETFGLGLGVLRVQDYVTFFSSTTPIDEEHVQVRWTFLAPTANGPEAAQEAALGFTSGLSQDIPIWENKRYVERPIVIKDERMILEHSEWCQQFYSDPSLAID